MQKYFFGRESLKKMLELDGRLTKALYFLIARTDIDVTVLETKRTEARQRELVTQGFSRSLRSKHLAQPYSLAVDIAPLLINEKGSHYIPWENTKQNRRYWYYISGIMRCATEQVLLSEKSSNYKFRWGGDFNGNSDLNDDDFLDLAHWEIVENA